MRHIFTLEDQFRLFFCSGGVLLQSVLITHSNVAVLLILSGFFFFFHVLHFNQLTVKCV